MSQLQRDATRRQPSTGPGAAAAPGGRRAAARGPASIHGGRWAAATSEARGGGGKGTGPGPRYSQQVAAHGGGDQHRDDHPGETPALAREGPAPEPRRGTPQGAPTHPRFGPLGTNQGAAMPTRPQKAEKRTSGSAKLCAVMAAPHRTAPAHCRAPPAAAQRRQPAPPIGRSARLGPARIQSARLGSARPPHGSAARSAQEHPGRHRRFTNSFMLHSSHPPPPPAPSQPGWAHTVLRTRGSGLGRPCVWRSGSRKGSPADALLGNSPELAHEPQCHAEQGQGARLVRSSHRRRDIQQQGADAQAHLPKREKRSEQLWVYHGYHAQHNVWC